MKKQVLIAISILFAGVQFSAYAASSDSVKANPKISELADYFEEKGYAFNRIMEDQRFKLIEDISGKFTRAVEIKIESFEDYQEIIKYERKRDAIADFVREYEKELSAAEEQYGISRHVIAGIIGIESEFGKYRGSYNPFNAYVSMYAEGYRSNFAKAQLEELLIFIQKNGLDVFELESSYAGAMSYAQFIPYSLNRWFVGSDLYDMPNNIASVANYLAHFKEVTGSLEKAVFRYNPSSMYTNAVLTLAEDSKRQHGD